MKKRKKVNSVLFIVFGLVFCIGGVFSQKAEADTSIKFQPRVSAGWMDYTLELKSSDSVGGIDWNLSDNMAVGSIGTTFFLSKFYLDLSYEHTAKGNAGLSAGRFYEAGDNPYIPLDADVTIVGDSEFYHWNYAITIGYQLLDNLSLYAGYKKNETSFDVDTQAIDHLIDDGSLTGTPGFPIFFTYIGDFDVDTETKGPFLGGTYGFIIGDKGVLSLNLAVAFLEGDINQSGKYIDPRTGVPDDLFDMDSSGDSIGLSYGIRWQSTLTDRLGYFLSFKGHNYDFDADNSNHSDFKETTYQFSIGLSYRFHFKSI
jgi:hypothetical protein